MLIVTGALVGNAEGVCTYSGNRFLCASKDLRVIPNDIKNVAYVNLENNEIEEIPENVFPATVTTIYLQDNRISIIHPKAFSVLKNLHYLNLQNNKITSSQFYPKMFYGKRNLVYLYLHNNELDTLHWDIFSPSDYRGSGGHPYNLQLSIGRNPMKCDLTTCWMKSGAEDGWLKWVKEWSVPQCVDTRVTWPNIGVDCAQFGRFASLFTPW